MFIYRSRNTKKPWLRKDVISLMNQDIALLRSFQPLWEVPPSMNISSLRD